MHYDLIRSQTLHVKCGALDLKKKKIDIFLVLQKKKKDSNAGKVANVR